MSRGHFANQFYLKNGMKCQYAYFYTAFERARQGELKPEKNGVNILKSK